MRIDRISPTCFQGFHEALQNDPCVFSSVRTCGLSCAMYASCDRIARFLNPRCFWVPCTQISMAKGSCSLVIFSCHRHADMFVNFFDPLLSAEVMLAL